MSIAHFVPGGSYDKLLQGICQYSQQPSLILFLDKANAENKNYLDEENIPFHEFNHENRGLSVVFLFPSLCKLLRKLEIDVVYLHSSRLFLFFLLNWIFKRTIFVPVRHHNEVHRIFNQRKGILIDRLVSKYSPHIVAVGEKVRDSIIEEGGKPCRITIIKNGIDTVEFRDINKETFQAFNEGSTVQVLLIGRIEKQKNYEFLIEIAKLSRVCPYDFQFYVFGTGAESYIAKLSEQISISGVSDLIHLGNWTSNINQILSKYPLLLHIALDEAFPLVLIEALCAGIPIVSTDAGGSGEVLFGRVDTINEFSAAAFLEKMISVVENYEEAIEVALKVKQIALRDFDQKIMAKNYFELGVVLGRIRKQH